MEEDQAPDPSGQIATSGGGSVAWLMICLLFTVLADFLFWDAPIGWTAGAYGSLLMGAIFSASPAPPGKAAWLIASALAALFLCFLEEPNSLSFILSILGLVSLAAVLREGWVSDASIWFRRWASFFFFSFLIITAEVIAFTSRAKVSQKEKSGFGRIAGNWALPLVLGSAFVALFAAANPVIALWLGDGWRAILDSLKNVPSFGRVAMWLLVGIGAWILLRYRSGFPFSAPSAPGDAPPCGSRLVPADVVVRSLALFNAIFGVQTALDAAHLVAGATLPEGITYAQYAQRGAYPLVAAALLAGLFVLASFRQGDQAHEMRWARRLVYVWLLQSVLLVGSAGWRLRLYVETFTLTRWRVAAGLWMVLVACGLVWTLIRIVRGRSNLWLCNVNAVSALILLYLCCFVNFDGLIADFNVRRCREASGSGPSIDLAYLTSLGPDTLPALVWLADHLEGTPDRQRVLAAIPPLRAQLRHDLRNWRGWTWRRHRLSRLPFPPGTSPEAPPTPNRAAFGRAMPPRPWLNPVVTASRQRPSQTRQYAAVSGTAAWAGRPCYEVFQAAPQQRLTALHPPAKIRREQRSGRILQEAGAR